MDSQKQDISNDMLRVVRKLAVCVHSGKAVAGTIDEEQMTVSVQLTIDDNSQDPNGSESIISEGVLLNVVSLNNNGVILYPADGSDVLVAEVDGPGNYVVIKCSNLVKAKLTIGASMVTVTDGLIQLNDGSLGGLVKVEALVSKINAIEELLNNLKTAVTAVVIAGSTADGGAVKAGIIAGLGSGITPTTLRGDIENTNIKQG